MRRFSLLFCAACFLIAGCSSSGSSSDDALMEDLLAGEVSDISVSDVSDSDLESTDQQDAVEDSQDATDTVETLDPSFIHKIDSLPVVGASETYLMDLPRHLYRTTEELPALNVASLTFGAGTVWAGSADGTLMKWNESEDRFEAVISQTIAVTPILDLLVEGASGDEWTVHVLQQGNLTRLSSQGDPLMLPAPEGESLVALTRCGDNLYISTAAGLIETVDTDEGTLVPMEAPAGVAVSDSTSLSCDTEGTLWLGTSEGLYRIEGQTWERKSAQEGNLLDDDVRDVIPLEGLAGVFVATQKGITRIDASGAHHIAAGVGGLPTDEARRLSLGGNRLLIAHEVGATSLENPTGEASDDRRYDHYVSRRWLPSDQVTDILVDPSQRLWVATTEGISRIEWVEQNLKSRAEAMEVYLDTNYWRMDGFVSSDASIEDPWNLDGPHHVWDKDNDGLWTEMQIGAWCYAYATTGDEQFYERARKAMDTMFLLTDIPGVDFEAAGLGAGFVARSLVRDDEGSVYDSKTTQSNWHPVEWEGHTYYWKDDTSSDEYAGHFYGYPLFYDLCAKTDEEREELGRRVAMITDYIIKNEWVLIDLDGISTGFGHWEPAEVSVAWQGFDVCTQDAMSQEDPIAYVAACASSWGGGGWLNSVEILGQLLATWHMTGEPRFYEAYEHLLIDEHYEVVAMPHEETYTITSPSIMNHSDHELAMLAYQTIIRYEPDGERRAKWIAGLQFLYDWELPERNPLWAGFLALSAGVEATDILPALQSLREMPDDRREWYVNNSHRLDAGKWPADRHDNAQVDTVFPYDEIRTIWWNGNFHSLEDGGDGRGLSGPMAWLLPYWALRYAGVISD